MRYLYVDADTSQPSLDREAQLIEALQTMSIEWQQQLQFVAQIADEEAVFRLLEQIPESQSGLANTLTELVHDFKLNQVISLTRLPIL